MILCVGLESVESLVLELPLEGAEGANSLLPGACSLQLQGKSRGHQDGIWYLAAFGNHLTLDSSGRNGTSPLAAGVCSWMVLRRLERIVFRRCCAVSALNW